jgi:predicted Zn-dependent protease
MKADALLALVKEALAAAGEAEAEAFASFSRRGFARFAMGELGQHLELEEPWAVVRVAHGARVAEAATTMLTKDALVGALRDAGRAAKLVPETEGFPGFTGADEPAGERPPRFAKSTEDATAEERVQRLAPVLSLVRDAGLVSAGLLETKVLAQAVATTRGLARSHDGTVASFKVWALETPGAGGAAGYGAHVHRDVGALDLEGETKRAIRICRMSKDPISLDAGTYDVVMEPDAVSELVEWLSSIAFSAPEVEQGTSALAGRFGERITGEAISITEDPLDASDLGFAVPFDREGVWRRKVHIVENGVARGALYDRTYGARMKAASTGSALAPESGGGAAVGGCAVSLSAGTASGVDELIAGMDRGLYVCRLHYVNGMLEPRRAVMTGLTRDGCFLVEKGKITKPVGNLRFTDSFLEALGRADGMTSRRVAVPTWWSSSGACIVPAVRMRGFRFNGRSQEKASF